MVISLNLIKPRKEEGVVFPEMIIFQPDYLVDISAIASCFKPYGNNFLNRLIDRIRPKETTVPILLGKFAGQLLDEALHSLLIDYKTSVKTFFKTINKISLSISLSNSSVSFSSEGTKSTISFSLSSVKGWFKL